MLLAKEPTAYTRLHATTSNLVQCPTMDEQHGSTNGHIQSSTHPQATGKPRWKSLWKCCANGLRTTKAVAAMQMFQMQLCRTPSMRLLRKKCPNQLSHQ